MSFKRGIHDKLQLSLIEHEVIKIEIKSPSYAMKKTLWIINYQNNREREGIMLEICVKIENIQFESYQSIVGMKA